MISKILQPHDIFAFTLEEYIEDTEYSAGWKLLQSGRFAHSQRYINDLTDICVGLSVVKIDRIIPRYLIVIV